jgi:hypothetical protein
MNEKITNRIVELEDRLHVTEWKELEVDSNDSTPDDSLVAPQGATSTANKGDGASQTPRYPQMYPTKSNPRHVAFECEKCPALLRETHVLQRFVNRTPFSAPFLLCYRRERDPSGCN